jgi:hypothetical protein
MVEINSSWTFVLLSLPWSKYAYVDCRLSTTPSCNISVLRIEAQKTSSPPSPLSSSTHVVSAQDRNLRLRRRRSILRLLHPLLSPPASRLDSHPHREQFEYRSWRVVLRRWVHSGWSRRGCLARCSFEGPRSVELGVSPAARRGIGREG